MAMQENHHHPQNGLEEMTSSSNKFRKSQRNHHKSFTNRNRMNPFYIAVAILTVFLVNLQSFAVSSPESEIFSSTTELQKLYRHELDVVRTLEQYAKALDKNLQVVQKYIKEFNKINSRLNINNDRNEDGEAFEIVENPMNAYHLLKRTVIDWEVVAESIKNHTQVGNLAGEVIRKGEQLPSFDDFIGGSMALVGLQDTYALNLTEIIHGDLPADEEANRNGDGGISQSPYELSARDCLFLGKAAFNKGLYDRAVGWLEMALSRSKEEENDEDPFIVPTASREEILPFLETTKRVHDDVLEKKGPYGETWQTFQKPLSGKLAKLKKYQKINSYKPKLMMPLSPVEENENFKALCRGEYLRSPKLDAPLRCRLIHRPDTISVLGPFKVEEYSKDPYIAMFHDFMSDSEMAEFKAKSTSRLRRSLHQGKDGRYVATDIRTSKQAWLKQNDGPLINKISRRIGEATALEVFPENEASEIYQVANYGMAGRYSPHTDYITGEDHLFNPLELIRGNRIATFMVYLEHVPAGGSTVFPLIGVQVKPKKGAAVFWWNLRSDGRGDPWTRHAGCSVLYGNKWITNKWIRYNHQFKRVPCIAEPNNKRTESFQMLAY